MMSLEIRDLVLEQDAGVLSLPYWTTSYKSLVTSISMRLCGSCVHKNVKVSTAVRAEVVKDDEA